MTGRPGLHPGHPTAEGGLPASKPGLSLALMTWFECTKHPPARAKSVTGCDFPGFGRDGNPPSGPAPRTVRSGALRLLGGTEPGFKVGEDIVDVLQAH
jgi:hypothetical protein